MNSPTYTPPWEVSHFRSELALKTPQNRLTLVRIPYPTHNPENTPTGRLYTRTGVLRPPVYPK